MPMLSDRGWDWVPVEGTETCRVPDEEVGVGGRKVFFHLVLCQGSDLGLDE